MKPKFPAAYTLPPPNASAVTMPFELGSQPEITPRAVSSAAMPARACPRRPMRRVAAEARRVLLDMASKKFEVPATQLEVSDGVVTVKGDPSKKVTYGDLIGGKKFNVALTAERNNVDNTTGVAKVKAVQDLKNVGQSPQRYDIPGKVDGSLTWAVDVKLPGMVHARNEPSTDRKSTR